MYNKIKVLFLILIAFTSLSFIKTDAEIKAIKIKESKVVWKGYKVTGSHTGTIAIKSGSLLLDDEVLKGGNFVIDMTSLSCTDLEAKRKEKLEEYLKSDDFFGVANHPTSILTLTKIKASGKNSFDVSGDLIIKEKKGIVNFVISIYGNKATASLKIDRTKYDVKYRSPNFVEAFKDKAIYDEFDLIVDLEF